MEIPLKTLQRFQIGSDLTTKAVNHLTERNLILKDILEIVNSERVNTKYKPLTGRALAIKTSHIPTKDLYYVLSVGKDYKNRKGSFSKFFFGSIKV